MKIILDVMSGDHAPEEIIRGAVAASKEFDTGITVVGQRELIRKIAFVNDLDISRLEIEQAKSVIDMEDAPLSVVRQKHDSSMAVGLKMLADGKGDAFVSAGNTGALVTGATLIVRRIKGVQRAGIATVLPFPVPVLLMDSGANLTLTSEHLEQFAFMGSKYMEKIYGIRRPRVGLLNCGTEYNKGNQLQVETYQLLLAQERLNFIGNVEGKDIPFNVCDVLVCDGFVGNILLKYSEGMGRFMMHTLRDMFRTNLMTFLSSVTMKDQLYALKKKFDASEHGGAPLLGIAKPVIKAHGSSDAYAIQNAVFQAMNFVSSGINDSIAEFTAWQEAERYRHHEEELHETQEQDEECASEEHPESVEETILQLSAPEDKTDKKIREKAEKRLREKEKYEQKANKRAEREEKKKK